MIDILQLVMKKIRFWKQCLSLSPLRLKTFPAKEKKKIVVLKKISEQFENKRRYLEKEVNEVIKGIFDDFATIRRYLIEYGFMEKNK